MNMNPILISIICLSIIFAATTLGSSLVFLFKKNFSDKLNNIITGLASGIMISASVFGLIIPSVNQAKENYGNFSSLVVVGSFLLGGLILYLFDKLIPHFHISSKQEEGIQTSKLSRHTKFMFAVTIHNIPEGLAIGLACGSLFNLQGEALDSAMTSALALAIGISIQNFPEGAAVSIPLLDDGLSKPKAFLLGSFSGIVEPIFGIIAIFIASGFSMAEPFLLAVAAGAMFYVTIDELLPDSRRGNYVHYGLWSFMIGFGIMMALELI